METQKTVIQAKPVTLSIEDQEEIIGFVKDCWQRGRDDRKKYMDHAKECKDAYNCYMPPIESPELDWMSNECLPWAFDAAESWFAHIHSTTIPKNDQIFTISGRTKEDHPGAEIMQKYLEYRFERNKFATQLGKAEKALAVSNHTCLKVYWREDITVEYNWIDEPVMGLGWDELTQQSIPVQIGSKRVRRPEEKAAFNNVWVDVIDVDNFVMWPIQGDFDKTTRIHETYRYYEDLMASADKTNYFNLSEIKLDDEKKTTNVQRPEEKGSPGKAPKGLNIKEAWISRVKIGDKVYRNYVATIVNDKTLIRFQPFPSSCPKSPFVFMALRPDGDCFYGYGLNSKGIGILNAANKKFNAWIDEGVLTQHGAHKYYDDGVYNPNNVIKRPGAQIKMADAQSVATNLIPLVENLAPQQQLMQDLAALKVEFETVTVPKVVKGMIETGRDATATEISQAQNNSNGKMHIDAYNINDCLITPVLELTYQAIYDRVDLDESIHSEIQQVAQPKNPETGAPLEQLPILPLPQVDIKVVGYQNVIRKQEALQNMGIAIPQLAQSPAGKYLQWPNLAEDTFTLMDLDKGRLLKDDAERKAVDEQEQAAAKEQQDLLVKQEMGKLQLQKEKQDQYHAIKMEELDLKRLELQLRYQMEEAKLEQQGEQAAHQAQMDAHGSSMAERQQQFNEAQSTKESPEDE